MKEVRIEIPSERQDTLDSLIIKSDLAYSKIKLVDDRYLYTIKVDDNKTNTLLHELKIRGVGTIFGEIIIRQMDLYMSAEKHESKIESSPAANVEEIIATLINSAVVSESYVALVVLAGALAAFGLISNSVVIIIGSMIVAPLLGPVALTSIGILIPGRDLFKKGIIAEIVGIGLTVGVSIIIGWIIKLQPNDVTLEMIQRAREADPLNVVFAVLSGIAAGLIISKGQGLSMVGVAIAASLAPPAANIGLFLSMGNFEDAGFATLLLLMNIVAINISCSIMFIIYRLPSKAGISKKRVSKSSQKSKIIITALVLLFIYIAYIFLKFLNFIS